MKLVSWWQVQNVAQIVIPKDEYDAHRNCVDIDKVYELDWTPAEPDKTGTAEARS